MADAPTHLDTPWLMAFYRANHRGLAAYAASLTGSLDEAEDVVHDAFAAALGARVQAESPAAYLYRMVRNKAMDRRRGAARCLVGLSIAGERVGVDAEELEAVKGALEALGGDAAEVVMLRARAGLTFPEVARVLGEPVGTVSARYTRALVLVREKLLKEGVV